MSKSGKGNNQDKRGNGQKGQTKGQKGNKDDSGKEKEVGALQKPKQEVKPRGPKPDYTPRESRVAEQSRLAIINAEGTEETKKALAELVPGTYYIRGQYFQIITRRKLVDGKVIMKDGQPVEFKVIEQVGSDNPAWISASLIYKDVVVEASLHKNPKVAETQKRIHELIRESAGPDAIKAAKTAYVKGVIEKEVAEKKVVEEERTVAEKKATEEKRLANASTDLGAMLHQGVCGYYKTPEGDVIFRLKFNPKSFFGDIFVERSTRDDIKVGTGFFISLSMLQHEKVLMNNKFTEGKREELFAWQSALHQFLCNLKANTPVPAMKAQVACSDNTASAVESVNESAVPVEKKAVSLKDAVKLEDAVAKLNHTSTGMFFVRVGNSKAYFQAEDGKLSLVSVTESFPKDHILSRIYSAHDKGIGFHMQDIRQQKQPLNEVDDVSGVKDAIRALRLFVRRVFLNQNSPNQATTSSQKVEVVYPAQSAGEQKGWVPPAFAVLQTLVEDSATVH